MVKVPKARPTGLDLKRTHPRPNQAQTSLETRKSKNYSHIKIKRWTEFINSELSTVKEKTTKVKFSDNIVLLEAAARNDITEGLSLTVFNLLSQGCHFSVTKKTVQSSVTKKNGSNRSLKF